jgi:hypothetical protein
MTIKTVDRPDSSQTRTTPKSVIEALVNTAVTGAAIEVNIGEMAPLNWQSNVRYHMRKHHLKLKYRVKSCENHETVVVAWTEPE